MCGPVVSGACVFLHLHSVLAPSGVCDRSVPHSMAPVWLLAGWYAHRGLVHSQQVSNNCALVCVHETVKGGECYAPFRFQFYMSAFDGGFQMRLKLDKLYVI